MFVECVAAEPFLIGGTIRFYVYTFQADLQDEAVPRDAARWRFALRDLRPDVYTVGQAYELRLQHAAGGAQCSRDVPKSRRG